MDSCAACGAPLAPDLQWCPQCYTPVPARPAGPFIRPGMSVRGLLPQKEPPVHEFSRVRPGPTSMGWVGRLGATVLLGVAAVLGYFFLFVGILGVTGRNYELLYLAVAVPVGFYFLFRLWRPSRVR